MSHPDEGLIHAWLDGQLPPEEAARVEQLVASDAEWAAAAAEARGLIAASARILSALDDVPSQVIPTAAPAPRRMPWWLRAAAAVVLVAGGSYAVMRSESTPVLERPSVATDGSVVSEAIDATPKTAPAQATNPAAPADAASKAGKGGAIDRVDRPAAAREVRDRFAGASNAVPTPQLAQRAAPGAAADTRATVPTAAPVTVAPLAANTAVMEARTEPARERALMGESSAKAAAVPPVPSLDAARDRTPMLRTSGTSASPSPPAPAALTDSPAAAARASTLMLRKAAPSAQDKTVGGLAREGATLPRMCFVVRDAVTTNTAGSAMHAVRQAGDTLFLMPDVVTSPLRAWVTAGNGARPGVRYTVADPATVTAIIGTPTGCAAP